jgi:hypothetical protein
MIPSRAVPSRNQYRRSAPSLARFNAASIITKRTRPTLVTIHMVELYKLLFIVYHHARLGCPSPWRGVDFDRRFHVPCASSDVASLPGQTMLTSAICSPRATFHASTLSRHDRSASRANCPRSLRCIERAAHFVWLVSTTSAVSIIVSMARDQCISIMMSSSGSSPSSHAVSILSPPAPCFLLSRLRLSVYSLVRVKR